MAGKIGIKMRDYAIAAAFVASLGAGADTLVASLAHAPDSDTVATAAEPRDIAASTLHAFAASSQAGR